MPWNLGIKSKCAKSSYRSDAEVEKWKEKCPVLRFRRYLEKSGLWDEKKEERFNREISDEISHAITIAKATERADLNYLIEHVYFDVPNTLKEQYAEVKNALRE